MRAKLCIQNSVKVQERNRNGQRNYFSLYTLALVFLFCDTLKVYVLKFSYLKLITPEDDHAD